MLWMAATSGLASVAVATRAPRAPAAGRISLRGY